MDAFLENCVPSSLLVICHCFVVYHFYEIQRCYCDNESQRERGSENYFLFLRFIREIFFKNSLE